MKKITLSLWLLFSAWLLNAQSRDLNYYLEQAKANSPLIHQSINDNKMVALDLKQVKAVLSRPVINLEGNVLFAPIVSHNNNSNRLEWISKGANNYSGYELALTDGGQYQALAALKQRLMANSELNANTHKADINTKINDNNIALTIHDLEQLVSYQYILCLKAASQTQNTHLLLLQVNEQLSILEQLVKNALYKQTDLLLLQIEKNNLAGSLNSYRAEYESNLHDLNLISGINDTTVVNLEKTLFKLTPDKIDYSNFLISYELDSSMISAEQSLYDQSYKPKLYLFANAGLNAVYRPAFNRLGFSTGITLSWTLFDGRQRRIQQQKTWISLNTNEFNKQNFITQTTLHQNKILNQIRSLQQRESITSIQIEQYNQLIESYNKELSRGNVSIMDLKNLLKEMAAKKQELVLLEMEQQSLISSYNYWNY